MSVHSTLTGADLHESKGVAAASANTVAVANGSGGTTWKLVPVASLDTTTIKGVGVVYLGGAIPNISSSGSNYLVPIPFNCLVTNIEYVLGGAITVANASVTFSNPGVGTMAGTTIPFTGSAVGTVVNQAVTGNNAVASGSYLNVTSGGGSTTAQLLYFTITLQLT